MRSAGKAERNSPSILLGYVHLHQATKHPPPQKKVIATPINTSRNRALIEQCGRCRSLHR